VILPTSVFPALTYHDANAGASHSLPYERRLLGDVRLGGPVESDDGVWNTVAAEEGRFVLAYLKIQ
jgi:hypothetical protein